MINFSENAVFNLKPIDEKAVQQDVTKLFVDGEIIIGAYKTIRDQVVFTNKRIITIDVQGITGKRKDFSTLPYSKLQYFSVQTPGFAEFIPDCEMELFLPMDLRLVLNLKAIAIL